jgi:transposase
VSVRGRRKHKQFTDNQYERLKKRYRAILDRGHEELPPIPPRANDRRSRVAKSDAHNLWERLQQYEDVVLLFARYPDVAFTNNRAERDLRMSKVKQKVSGCFRIPQYANAYCRISSYLQTMANRGYNPLVAIQLALSGELYEMPDHLGRLPGG